MTISVVFETHSITVDNEAGRAPGWLPGELAPRGREGALALGRRRADDGLAAVFSSDLRRAVQTAQVHAVRAAYLDVPYPGGESWRQATGRVRGFLDDLPTRWDGERVLVIGHVATRWGLDHWLRGVPLEDLAAQDFAWQEGWEYQLG